MKKIDDKGFTLVELMIALVLASIVFVGIYRFYVGYIRSSGTQDQVIQMQQNARVAISDLERDIRMAGVGVDAADNQPVFIYAGPYGVAFNAAIDSTLSAINPLMSPAQVPANPAAGIDPYKPTINYTGGAETIRWTLDSNDDGVIDNNDATATVDPTSTTNPSIYQLHREVYGYNAATNTNGEANGQPFNAVAAEQIRGPNIYPDGSRPMPIFQYWIREDHNGDGIIDNGEINVNGSTDGAGNPTADEYLWGDDGSNGGIANNGILEPGEIQALIQNNKVLDTTGTVITAANGDSRVAGSTRAVELANVTRVMVTLISETTQPDKNYTTSPHGSSYPYREAVFGATIEPRNPNTTIIPSASLVLSASPLSVACPATQSTITAQALSSSGTPVSGVVITFTISSASFSSSSTVLTATATTNSSGLATATLYNSGGPRSTSVSAAGTISGNSYTGITTVSFVSGSANSITASGNPQSLPADGSSVSAITATVADQCGNRVADGTTVDFSLTTNPVGIGGAMNPIEAQTVSGNVSTTLTSTTSSGVGTVAATAGTATGSAVVNFTGCSLGLVPQSSGIPHDGISQTNITGTLKDLSGNPVSSTLINFATTDGSLGPSGSKTTSATTDVNGQATIQITSSLLPHTATITGTVPSDAAFCSNTIGSTQVSFTTCNASVVANPAAIAKNSTSSITATYTDSTSGSPLPNENVTFSINNALGTLSSTSGVTNGSGQASVNFTSGATEGTTKVTATSSCGSGSVSIPILSCVVVVSANPQLVTPDGVSTSAITATLTDTITNAPMANQTVNFSTNLGTFTSSSSVTTDSNGNAVATLQSTSSPGTATVTASSLCGSGATTVYFNKWGISLAANPVNVNWNGKTSALTATITENGVTTQPPAGSVVTFSFISPPGNLSASLSPNPATPSGGVATTTLTSGSGTGTVTVQAAVTISGVTITGQTNVTISAVGGQLILNAGTPITCDKDEEVAFSIKNTDPTNAVTLNNMSITWNKATAYLGEIISEGSVTKCTGGSDIWKYNGCGGSGSRLLSVASTSASACKTATIPANSTYVFNQLLYNTAATGGGAKISMAGGVAFAITFSYTLGANPTILTSTINFTTP